jgi:hypothetical protein
MHHVARVSTNIYIYINLRTQQMSVLVWWSVLSIRHCTGTETCCEIVAGTLHVSWPLLLADRVFYSLCRLSIVYDQWADISFRKWTWEQSKQMFLCTELWCMTRDVPTGSFKRNCTVLIHRYAMCPRPAVGYSIRAPAYYATTRR